MIDFDKKTDIEIFDKLKTESDEAPEIVELAGYQVTKAELFAHTKDPAITVWDNKIKFNMACLRKFPGVSHIQLLIHPKQQRLIIRPCQPDVPDSLRWATGGGEKEIKNRDMICAIFAAKLFDLMGWNKSYRYKILGKPAVCDNEVLYLFKLTDFEMFVNTGTRKTRSYLPEDWRDCFGTPFEEHESGNNIKTSASIVKCVRVRQSTQSFSTQKRSGVISINDILCSDDNCTVAETVSLEMVLRYFSKYSTTDSFE